jgi:hypothetical protein
VLEGKHVEPFVAHLDRSGRTIPERVAADLLKTRASFRRARLAYRDVASISNRVSLIAAILPAGVVTTHTLFCLETALDENDQDFLCGMLNSYVANYLVRQVMTTHLGSATVEALRLPKPARGSPVFNEIARLSRALRIPSASQTAALARLQAMAAAAYELTTDDFRHVLNTFPLVPEQERSVVFEEFVRGEGVRS